VYGKTFKGKIVNKKLFCKRICLRENSESYKEENLTKFYRERKNEWQFDRRYLLVYWKPNTVAAQQVQEQKLWALFFLELGAYQLTEILRPDRT